MGALRLGGFGVHDDPCRIGIVRTSGEALSRVARATLPGLEPCFPGDHYKKSPRCNYTLANCEARTKSSLRFDVDMLSYSLPNFSTGLATLGRAGIRADLGRPWLS
jgi:hypothetical protein